MSAVSLNNFILGDYSGCHTNFVSDAIQQRLDVIQAKPGIPATESFGDAELDDVRLLRFPGFIFVMRYSSVLRNSKSTLTPSGTTNPLAWLMAPMTVVNSVLSETGSWATIFTSAACESESSPLTAVTIVPSYVIVVS